MVYLFDVDGTLTPSRDNIVPAFKKEFLNFCKNNSVSLVTGSDYEKTLEQLGEDILNAVEFSFNCSGNAVYKKGKLIHQSDWAVTPSLREFLEDQLTRTKYTGVKTGNHIEERIGTINFSVVGRNANADQRAEYYQWDCISKERNTIAARIKTNFSAIDAVVGGETGVDLFLIGKDKSQVLKWFNGSVTFFGDRCNPGGNDYSLAATIQEQKRGTFFQVKDWQHTRTILTGIVNEPVAFYTEILQ